MEPQITKDLLKKLYEQDKKSCREIGEIINKSIKSVSRYLQKFEIKTRPFSTKGLKTCLGRKCSEETKEKIRKKHKGKKLSEIHKDKIRKWMLENNPFRGKHHTEESKQKQRKKMYGRKLTSEHREKVLRTLQFGEKYKFKGNLHPHWKGGISGINARIRNSKSYKEWRKKIFERDNYTCICCGAKEEIQADHIAPFALFQELRFSVDNGRTLCKECHKKTNTFGYKKIYSKSRKLKVKKIT